MQNDQELLKPISKVCKRKTKPHKRKADIQQQIDESLNADKTKKFNDHNYLEIKVESLDESKLSHHCNNQGSDVVRKSEETIYENIVKHENTSNLMYGEPSCVEIKIENIVENETNNDKANDHMYDAALTVFKTEETDIKKANKQNSQTLETNINNKTTAAAPTQKLFSCQLCQISCTDADSLNTHMRGHNKNKPISCELCDYRCSRNSHLTSHMKTHSGDKSFSCEICLFKSSAGGGIAKHMKTHLGDKGFSCKLCPYKFTTTIDLGRHMETHSKKQ